MKHRSLHVVCFGFLIVSLVGCSTVERRIRERPADFAALTPGWKELVLAGEITEGMSPSAVYLAWGRPTAISAGQRRGKPAETWLYQASSTHTLPDAHLFWRGPGGYLWGGPSFVTVVERHLLKWAAFEDRRVVAWEALKR